MQQELTPTLPQTNVQALPITPAQPWLAPLAGHTDLAFRVLCREHGAAVACTEMISAKGLVYGQRSRKASSGTKDLLLTTPLDNFPAAAQADSPLVAQIFGEDPAFLAEATQLLCDWGFKYFDLNMGCSVPKVVKTGAGSALSRYTSTALKAAEAILKVAPTGCTGFKFRLGWCSEEENYLELGQALANAGAAWLTLHPRYARQGFSGIANWQALANLKKCVNIPVIASGDLFTAEDAARCLRQTQVDAVMFARGAMQNPAVFEEYCLLLEQGLEKKPELALNMRAQKAKSMILRHAELARAMPGEAARQQKHPGKPPMSLMKMRGAIPRYVKELPGSRFFRQELTQCTSWQDFYNLVENYFTEINKAADKQ
ncbi:tRNA-dihydrouridine synthase family protein [Desulfovibrio sp. OttesenSCG-928-F07]|nr:tRNA-dihydrouridine synthase family protein [Desulfovibrio sp. OttesenSCG-928-F07]